MFILMHCGGMPFDGGSFQTQSLGGSESAAYYLAKELAARGHKVIQFTNSQKEGVWDGVKYCFAGPPSEGNPLGDRFHFFVDHTPHDLCIAQRHPLAFRRRTAGGMNFWWMHDLALASQIPIVNSQLWNTDRVMVVSDHHAEQVKSVYGIPKDRMIIARNGVDGSTYANAPKLFDHVHESSKVQLVYSSRPERGLIHLLREGGIMEQLEVHAPGSFNLNVCMYANFPPQMAELYGYLTQRADALPNVTNVGTLTKTQLASLQLAADAWVYPTEFEEVSCITAMEAVVSGLKIITSDSGAIRETLRKLGVNDALIPLTNDGVANEALFVERLLRLRKPTTRLTRFDAAPWSSAADAVESAVQDCLSEAQPSKGAIARHLVRTSDIYALDYWRKNILSADDHKDPLVAACFEEVDSCYKFAFDRKWSQHYEAYYRYERDRGVNYGPEKLDGNTRFEGVSLIIKNAGLPPGSKVLDYGCAHGHYSVNLAKRFPHLEFTGWDIEASNVEKARKWAEDDGVENVWFHQKTINDDAALEHWEQFDLIIAAEVLEHLEDVGGTVDKLASCLKPDGTMIITTPFGPWEYIGAVEHHPWRAHVHHLDRADLHELFGHHPGFNVQVAVAGPTEEDEPLGSYVTTFSKPREASGSVNYSRKIRNLVPRQTLALCMIVKDAEESLRKAVRSVIGVVDEVVIAIDETTTDDTAAVIERIKALTNGCPVPRFEVFKIPSPLRIGFDEARNLAIERASADWILWFDGDEHVEGAKNIAKYLRNNHYNGYAVDHIHLSVDPPGALRIDKPSRLFRNRKGIRFYGVVHEHPEIEINAGVGHAIFIPDVKISHVGYSTESVRIKRFHRNIDLMARDREKYPQRQIGKFLWVRDLSMMCKFEMDRTGGAVTDSVLNKAQSGALLFEELIGTAEDRMLLDGLEYYSTLCAILGGMEMAFQLSTSKHLGGMNGAGPQYRGVFRNTEQGQRFVNRIFTERTKGYESKYV